jgi:GNAT superfamily N-acetyltransferase
MARAVRLGHAPRVTLVPFTHDHVLPAAALVAADIDRLRRRVPPIPPSWTDPAHVARVLAGLADHGTGLAAIDDDDLVAFQSAITIDGRGGRWTYTSDVGHAVPRDPGGRLRTRLYAALADGWLRGACTEHVISVPADDEVALATYARLGFGQHVVDLIAPLAPIERGPIATNVTVRRAGPADAAAVAELDTQLRHHLEASPIFVRPGAPPAVEVGRERLADSAIATFVAERDRAAVAFLRIGPCATDVATIVRDPATASVTAVFTRPEVRGREIGSHLLAAAVAWAETEGYARWAVDHEAANGEAYRFWARHATAVTVSMSRRLAPSLIS